MKHISFLLGSGFSIPDGYPPTSQINERLKKINADEIHIHSDMSARFLNGEHNPNSYSRSEEKLFIQRFLEFYNSVILNGAPFHYEVFYDYYINLHRTTDLDEVTQQFFKSYKNETSRNDDHQNLLMNFNFTFNQLLASLIRKWPEIFSFHNRTEPNYAEFLDFLDLLKSEYKIHIHSLNHDLLIEKLSYSFAIGKDISDGFEEIGSPFYGDHNLFERNTDIKRAVLPILLKRFTNEYSNKICLYKLHGSVDNYTFNFKNKEYTMIKIPYGVQRESIRKEHLLESNSLGYYEDHFQIMPDFLSGTSTKIESYDRQNYYKPLFNNFITNLNNSSRIVVIGYGFGDSKINEYLKVNFLSDKSKLMVVIDIKKPENDLLDKTNVRFIECDISLIDHKFLYKFIHL